MSKRKPKKPIQDETTKRVSTPTRNYGFDDSELVNPEPSWDWKRWLALVFALLFLGAVWYGLDQKLLWGSDWISETYDHEDWRTNEGNLHTYGAWDLEAHVWKSVYILEYYPDYHWNPYWYLGMPLIKYYQLGFYAVHILTMFLTGYSAARASLVLIIFAHLAATFVTFLLCYKVSRRIWVSALASSFLLSNTFLSLRSYGWEPITVVFLFLYPLGLLFFLKDPLRPYRLSIILTIGVAYLCHPLIWYSLLMTMGLYIFSLAVKRSLENKKEALRALWQYFALAFTSILVGAVQFIPQFTYDQVTSGAHMGVTYLPFYHVAMNVITLKDFMFDMGNLKGPGPIVMIAFLMIIMFAIIEWRHRKDPKNSKLGRMLHEHEMVVGLAFALFMMVVFYYLEMFNIFPMNILRSIQYHRIIPEFIITAGVLIAALSNIAYTYKHKIVYYALLIAFVLASGIIVYGVQTNWQTTEDIMEDPAVRKLEFIDEPIQGRFSIPYTDQSLSVRNSFMNVPQVYGYYEQGITNPYNDEIFSVSSGFHNAELTGLYLKAANVGRLYVNLEEGERDRIVMYRLNDTFEFTKWNERYGYFSIPLTDASFAQAISAAKAAEVQELRPGCRELFKEEYCGSVGEEFVSTDPQEIAYLSSYVDLLDLSYDPKADMVMDNPDTYPIRLTDATEDTAVVVKMSYDHDFRAYVAGEEVTIEPFGPDFMLIKPGRSGDYTVMLEYHTSPVRAIGAIISAATLILLFIGFSKKPKMPWTKAARFPRGDMK